MALGMTPEEYWDGDSELCRYYRKAFELKTKLQNQQAWLQGMYFYEALIDASPVFHDLAKRGTKPHPYSSEPYQMGRKDTKPEANDRKAKAVMESFMVAFNKRFEAGEKKNAR